MASRKIEDLYPPVQPLFRNLLAEAQKLMPGWTAFITDGLRTHEEQAQLYAEGRGSYTYNGKVYHQKGSKIVTNAKPGYSFHEYGLAVDIGWQKDGALSYAGLDKLGPIGRKMGFTWGADFGDKPHFEYSGGLTINQVKAGQRPKVGSTVDEMDKTTFIKYVYRATQGREPSASELSFAQGLSEEQLVQLRFRDDVIGGYWKVSDGTDCPESEKDFWQNAINIDQTIFSLQTQWFNDHVVAKINAATAGMAITDEKKKQIAQEYVIKKLFS